MAKEYVSSCCKAEVRVVAGSKDFLGSQKQDISTMHYVCKKCRKPCDPIKKGGVVKDSADLLKKGGVPWDGKNM